MVIGWNGKFLKQKRMPSSQIKENIYMKVVPLDDDVLAVRSIVNLSFTFDHRVLDGIYGCGFLNALKKHLEEDTEID